MPRLDRRTTGGIIVAVLVLTVSGTLFRLLTAVSEFVRIQWQDVSPEASEWMLLVAILVVFAAVSLLALAGLVRLFTSVSVVGSQVAHKIGRLRPESAATAALVFMIAFTVVLFVGLAVVLPWFGASLTGETGVDNVAEDIQQGDVVIEIEQYFADDAVERGNGTDIPRKRFYDDRDGDGLADEWERLGHTPDGTPLPGANPGRLDLYVQINYGDSVSQLSDVERKQLRTVWSSMSVENPDGTNGITLHLVDGGTLDRPVSITDDMDPDQFYTGQRLGNRLCTYHQVTLATSQQTNTVGYAEAPGYASVVDGDEFADYDGDVSLRVATITHALLHNVVGEVNGQTHSTGGWLDYPAPGNERLTDSVGGQITSDGFVTSSAHRQECAS